MVAAAAKWAALAGGEEGLFEREREVDEKERGDVVAGGTNRGETRRGVRKRR